MTRKLRVEFPGALYHVVNRGARTETTTAPDGSCTIIAYSYGRLISTTRYDSNSVQIAQTSFAYDAHGRQKTVTDARNGPTTYAYNNADLVTSVTTPNPGTIGGSAQTTTTYYDNLLRATNVVNPDGTSVSTQYLPTGEVATNSGARTYPVSYTYDYAGRMKTMTTWSGFPTNGARVTTWNYDGYRGFLTNKAYPDGTGPLYAYTPGGRLASRTWARGITTAYGYNTAGDLATTTYSDGVTPNVTNTFDRLGRNATITWGVAGSISTASFAYDTANDLLAEVYSGGTLAGLAVINAYDVFLRRTAVALSNQPTTLVQYGYDGAGRLSNVTNGSSVATYSYVANSPLVSQIVFKQSGTTRMTTTKQYDYLNRLTFISSLPSAASPISFNYTYNSANQRIRNTLADNSYWSYQYDSLGQVTYGHKFWSDQTPVAGQQFGYAFDDIGNRTQTLSGGDNAGQSLRPANYSVNSLNQYTSRDVPGFIDIKGVSIATNTVTVNGQTAYRKGEYFRAELPMTNNVGPIWTNITVAATGQSSATGAVFLAKTPESFTYDADGNLTQDGRWTYIWDAENRIINMTGLSSSPTCSKLKLDFVYDSKGRRIQKLVSTNNGSAYFPQSTNRFVYDGWNLIGQSEEVTGASLTFLWGVDLSGTSQGAGGVGGLKAITVRQGTTAGTYFCGYDGNGNVTTLINSADGTEAAHYEYGPFGEVIRQTGIIVKSNPFRFSTKYQDDETELLCYGHRFYVTATGRWLNRDDIAENGGVNLYEIVGNNSVVDVDFLGMDSAKNDKVIKKTEGQIEYWLKDEDRKKKLPLASLFLDNWYHGGRQNPLILSDKWVEHIFATKQGKDAIKQLDQKALVECAKINLQKGGKIDNTTITFAGRPQEGGANSGVKEEFTPPLSTLSSASDAWDMFFAFHNVYFDAVYTGCIRRDNDGKVSFNGDVKYRVFDKYIFVDRGWFAIPIAGAPSDSDMWQVQQYGPAKAFDDEGYKTVKDISIQNNNSH